MAKRMWSTLVFVNVGTLFVACSSNALVGDLGEENTRDASTTSSSTTLRDASAKEGGSSDDANVSTSDTGQGDADLDAPSVDAGKDDSSSNGSNDAASDTAIVDAKPDVSFSFDTGAPALDGGLTADATCAQATATATAIALDMYVMLDRSGSMGTDCNVGATTNSKWCKAINALSTYFGATDAAGNAAAIQYFPLDSGGACDGTGYSSAASPSSGFTSLPSSGFTASLNAQTASGGTPMEGAIRGITGFTSKASNQRVGRKLIGVLITDGDPNGCNTSIPALAGLLSTHFAATGHETFVIGMTGANFTSLESLAVGGGAPVHNDIVSSLTDACGTTGNTCRHWNVGDGNGNALAEAMKQIQKSALACSYAMPTTDGGIVDPNQVKVEYRAGGTGTPQTFGKVTGVANCTTAGGFYYDNNSLPTSLTLCPSTCGTVQADTKAKVDILLGCLGS